jgi:hypothetical protein
MEKSGVSEMVFCDGTVSDPLGFAEEMTAGHVHPFLVCEDDVAKCLVWLTNFEGRSCRGHLVFLQCDKRDTRRVASYAIRWLLSQVDSNNEHCFDVVIGSVPASNMRAINLAKKCGFVYIGTVPNGAWVEKCRKSIDMTILAATRGDVS